MVAQPFLHEGARSIPKHLLPLQILDLGSYQLLVLLLPPTRQRHTATLSPLSGTYCTGTKTKFYSVDNISSASASDASVKVEGGIGGGTFIAAPSDGSAPTATASATGNADSSSGSGPGGQGSEGGECHDSAAPPETEAAGGDDGADVTVTIKTSMTLQITVTSNVPPAASDTASAPAAASTGEAPGSGAGAGAGAEGVSGSGSGSDSGASASAPDSAPPAATSGLGDNANDAAGSGSGASHEKKQCKSDEVAVCFDDGYFGICDNGWAVLQKVSAGMRCENESLVHSAMRKGGKRAESYVSGEGHARMHLRKRGGRFF